jgi:glycosyltransferase involved in cell wall biosynthesis
MNQAPVLISLSRGLWAAGVCTWAVRTAEVLALRGRQVALMVHRDDPGMQRLQPALPSGVKVFDIGHLPPLDSCAGDLAPYIPPYRDVLRSMVAATKLPVVYIPTSLGDSVGIAAALSVADPELIRVVAWQHSPIPYEAAVIARYEPLFSQFVGVSDQISHAIRSAHPSRSADIRTVLHGVPTPPACPQRPSLEGRDLSLIYAGRLENDLKRSSSLIAISDELARRGVRHRLTIVGDGPAAEEIDDAIRLEGRSARIRRLRSISTEGVQRLLGEHDCSLLPSRVEGLSLSAMESMAAGCVPIITRTPSGSTTLVDHEHNGMLVDVAATDADDAVGRAFASAVERALSLGIQRLSAAAHHKAVDRFSLSAYGDAVDQVLHAASVSGFRRWPTDRPCAFTTAAATAGGSGAVPADGAARLRDLLARLAGRSIVIHGTGRHSLELASVLAESPAKIVAFTDDDPKRHGQKLWNWPIVSPAAAARTGAGEVVISSWMNQDVIWERREVYEQQGLKVHRVYA